MTYAITMINKLEYQFANSAYERDFNIADRNAEHIRNDLIECEIETAMAAVADLEEKIENVGGRLIGIHPTEGVFIKEFGPGGAGPVLAEFTANYSDKLGEDLVGWSPAPPPDWTVEAGASVEGDEEWQLIDLTTLTGEAKVVPCICYFEKHDTRPNPIATSLILARLTGDTIEGRIAFVVEKAA